jgi:hypothetical protein
LWGHRMALKGKDNGKEGTKDMSSEARVGEAFLCVLASHQLKVSDDQSETFNC